MIFQQQFKHIQKLFNSHLTTSCEKQCLLLVKMQNHPQLLRRPLPPKLPKLPLYKKKVRTAKTVETQPPRVKFAQDETISTERDKISFRDVSRNQSQTLFNIQNLFSGRHIQKRVTTISTPEKTSKKGYWHIPEIATGSKFFPSFHSASSQVLGKETSQMESSRKSKEKPSKIKNVYVDNMLTDVLIFSSAFSKPSSAPSPVTTPTLTEVHSEYLHLPNSRTFTFNQPLMDLTRTVPSPLPRSIPVKAERQLSDGSQQSTTVVLSISHFPGTISLPPPTLPRKPRRLSMIGLIKPRKKEESEGYVIYGEAFKTIAATQYETITAMTNLAITNCQIHGRNALNLKGFFILNCPDLTPLAFQLVYLNLSFNDISCFPTEILCLQNLQILNLRSNPIKEIPSEIQQLKFLRVFNVAFNLITTLPPGLFSLFHLETFDISYNNIAFIPNEIQKLRSLEKLLVDGNDLTAFPPGILKLNLKSILFENNYTHPSLWRENSLNSPQSLTQLTSLFFLKNNLWKRYDVIPGKIQKLLKWTSRCEWCHGPKFGEGFRVIRSFDIFGATHLPVMFHVCSSSCYRKAKESSFVVDNIPGKKTALNSELSQAQIYESHLKSH